MRLQGKKRGRVDDAARKRRRSPPRVDGERLARFQCRLLAWYRRLTPSAPAFETALLPDDSLDEDPRFRLRRIPAGQRWMAAAGVASLAALVVVARALR